MQYVITNFFIVPIDNDFVFGLNRFWITQFHPLFYPFQQTAISVPFLWHPGEMGTLLSCIITTHKSIMRYFYTN